MKIMMEMSKYTWIIEKEILRLCFIFLSVADDFDDDVDEDNIEELEQPEV